MLFTSTSSPLPMFSMSRVLSLGLGLVVTLTAASASAADVKLLILGADVVDAETGVRNMEILNPSKQAQLVYTSWGFNLNYVDKDGKPAKIALHADFPERPPDTSNPQIDFRNGMLAELIEVGGRIQAGEFLKTLPAKFEAEGKEVALSFSTKNRAGFVVSDYGFNDVTVLVEGAPRLSLQQIVMNILSSRADHQMAQMAADAAAAQAEAEAAPKRPVLTAAVVGARVCGQLFRPTVR